MRIKKDPLTLNEDLTKLACNLYSFTVENIILREDLIFSSFAL